MHPPTRASIVHEHTLTQGHQDTPSAQEVFALIAPDAQTQKTGAWMCAGARENGSTYSQAITWDGAQLRAAIENSNGKETFKLHIQGDSQQCQATLNETSVPLEEALALFCEHSAQMPKATSLPRRNTPGRAR